MKRSTASKTAPFSFIPHLDVPKLVCPLVLSGIEWSANLYNIPRYKPNNLDPFVTEDNSGGSLCIKSSNIEDGSHAGLVIKLPFISRLISKITRLKFG